MIIGPIAGQYFLTVADHLGVKKKGQPRGRIRELQGPFGKATLLPHAGDGCPDGCRGHGAEVGEVVAG